MCTERNFALRGGTATLHFDMVNKSIIFLLLSRAGRCFIMSGPTIMKYGAVKSYKQYE